MQQVCTLWASESIFLRYWWHIRHGKWKVLTDFTMEPVVLLQYQYMYIVHFLYNSPTSVQICLRKDLLKWLVKKYGYTCSIGRTSSCPSCGPGRCWPSSLLPPGSMSEVSSYIEQIPTCPSRIQTKMSNMNWLVQQPYFLFPYLFLMVHLVIW